jgi:hypothetical protein
MNRGASICVRQSVRRSRTGQPVATAEKTTDVNVTDAYADKSYRGHDHPEETNVHLAAASSTRRLTRTKKRRRQRRGVVEPK